MGTEFGNWIKKCIFIIQIKPILFNNLKLLKVKRLDFGETGVEKQL